MQDHTKLRATVRRVFKTTIKGRRHYRLLYGQLQAALSRSDLSEPLQASIKRTFNRKAQVPCRY